MNKDEYVKRLEEIVRDSLTFDWLHKDSVQYESKIDEVTQAIQALNDEAIEASRPKTEWRINGNVAVGKEPFFIPDDFKRIAGSK